MHFFSRCFKISRSNCRFKNFALHPTPRTDTAVTAAEYSPAELSFQNTDRCVVLPPQRQQLSFYFCRGNNKQHEVRRAAKFKWILQGKWTQTVGKVRSDVESSDAGASGIEFETESPIFVMFFGVCKIWLQRWEWQKRVTDRESTWVEEIMEQANQVEENADVVPEIAARCEICMQ